LFFTPTSALESNNKSSQSETSQKTKIKKSTIQEQQEKTEKKIQKNKKSSSNKKEASLKEKEEKEIPDKTITIKNDITPDMISYKHWSGTYEPSFTLSVNGKKIGQGEQEKIIVKDNQFDVRYDYSFANGFRKGANIVSCQLDHDADKVDITFSWKDDWRIQSKQAQPQKTENTAYSV
jgi:hypothetical protein